MDSHHIQVNYYQLGDSRHDICTICVRILGFVLLDIDSGIDDPRLPFDRGELQQEDFCSTLWLARSKSA